MLLEKSEKLENIINKYNLLDMVSIYQNEYAISKTDELKKALNSLKEEGRLLKIGVVGRVKAGKSSLLNSLMFDAKEILPKAATPMTAALTILEYSDEVGAEVEFFTKEDIEDIKANYTKYKQKLDEKTSQKYEELLENAKRKNKPIDENDLKQKAQKRAKRELTELESLSSAYEQYSKIKDSNITINKLSNYTSIKASSPEELNQKLTSFVGANGKYMPFTKSVTLKLNEPSLKEIQIIDTPGVNDPVISREERTKELLKYCDAVLIISPSGQFLSSEDITLFDRINSKEAIQEVYIVASQVDTQLFSSEKERAGGVFHKALENITLSLTQLARDIFSNDEDLRNTKFYKDILKNDILISSSIAYSIYKKFNTPELMNNEEQHILKLLKTHYPDYLEDKIAKETLLTLSNIQNIQNVIQNIKSKKESILQEKEQNFEKEKLKNLQNYQEAIISEIEDKITQLQNGDIEKTKKQLSHLQQIEKSASISIDEVYYDLVEELETSLKSILIDRLNSYFKQTKKDINESEDSVTETWNEEYTIDKGSGFLWWRDLTGTRYETKTRTHSETYTTARAGFVRNSLEELTDNIEITISIASKEFLQNWRKEVFRELVSTLRKEVGDENLDVSTIQRTIRKVINSVNMPDISYSGNFPKYLKKSGTLKGSEAENFLDDAHNYVSDLKHRVKSDINSYMKSLLKSLKKIDISKDIFSGYKKEIETLKENIQNRELILEKYSRIIDELKGV
jgi:hypothetical protein